MRHFTFTFLALSACAPNMTIPLEVELEAARIDVDAERTALEDALCSSASEDCDVLRRLDRSDDRRVAATPRMPEKIPTVIDDTLVVADWINAVRAQHELVPEQLIALKVPSGLPSDGLESLMIEDAAIVVEQSSLSFNIPAYDIHLDGEFIARTDSVPAATDHRANLYLVDGATDRLRAALKSGAANLVLTPSEANLELLIDDDGRLHRPGGAATISLDLAIAIPLSAL
jgi:hypothetical protein